LLIDADGVRDIFSEQDPINRQRIRLGSSLVVEPLFFKQKPRVAMPSPLSIIGLLVIITLSDISYAQLNFFNKLSILVIYRELKLTGT
jgi:hypothetical protein